MKIAIYGAGRIGTTFAYYLARAGHDLTLIARGARLKELEAAQEIVTVDGQRVAVKAAGTLDKQTPWDLVLVTVLAHQVAPVLPELKACAAKTVMFMFNTFGSIAPLREVVGAERFAFAFPTVIAHFDEGKLRSVVNGPGQDVTTNSEVWARVFKEAGIPSVIEPDMESFLRSHVAFVIPLMVLGNTAWGRKAGITWREAGLYVKGMREAFAVVKGLGNKLIPRMVGALNAMPGFMVRFLFWVASRLSAIAEVGALGPTEVQQLIDAVVAVAPDKTPTLKAMRPQ